MKFNERELKEDRVCNLVMLEVMDGILLSKISSKRFAPAERSQIAKSVLEIARTAYENGVFFGDIFLNNFLYLEKDKTIRFFGFSHTYDPEAAGIIGQEKADQIGSMLIGLRSRLEERGYL